jgi:hypothetical protein
MKLIFFLIIFLIPSELYAGGIANDIREMIQEGAILILLASFLHFYFKLCSIFFNS